MGTAKRYASAAIILGGGAIGGAAMLGNTPSNMRNTGIPINSNGKQYFIQNDSKRVRYPSKEACLKDVPVSRQAECEPVSSYSGAHGGAWYGPVFSNRDTGAYRPNGQFPTENASQFNTGKKLPSTANVHGFGDNGKAFTGSKGS